MDSNTKTEWYGGDLTNLRLHKIQEALSECAISNDINLWIKLLQRRNHELRGFQNDKEKEQIEKELRTLAELINEYQIKKSYSKGRFKPTIPKEVINELNRMEFILDEIFHRSGLQTKLGEDASDSFS